MSMLRDIGYVFVAGSGWCGHLLNVDAANVANSQFFILGMFLASPGNGRLSGLEGGARLSKQPHGAHFGIVEATVETVPSSPSLVLASPAVGNDLVITYSAVRTCRDR